MKETTIKQLKPGDFFTLKPIEEPTENRVYVRDEYDRTEKRYYCYKFSDVNSGRYMPGNKTVYTDFTF